MYLLVVESPSKAKTIQKYLGSEYVVRPTVGHIMDLAKGKGAGLGVDVDNEFKPKYVVIFDKKDKIAAIKDSARQAKEILIASDPDREGEAIAWHVAEQLKDLKKPIKRILFNEITKAGIKKGLSNPLELNKDLYDAQQARRVLDRLVGFLVSPYLINSLGPNLSAGRVQSVCLRLIVDRERERESFVPEVYYNITAVLTKKNKESFAAKYPTKVTDEKLAIKIKTDLEGSTFVVEKIESKEQKRNPPAPLNTSKLQQLAASVYKLSASKTMRAAQSLYEHGYVTYIRTDSLRCSPESITEVRSWISAQGHDVPKVPNVYKNKDAAQDAHEAIRPTDINLTASDFAGGDGDEAKLYKLVWEYFVASQMNPAIYDTVGVDIKTSSGHKLRANGRTLKYPGWLAVTVDLETKKEDDVKLPILKVGEDLFLVSPPGIKVERKETQPPSRYTDGSLIKELEKRGIGRPSTYAAILSKISDRSYVEKEKIQYYPTSLGRQVVDNLIKHFTFMDYDYTKNMEDRLDKISEGQLQYLNMLTDFFEPFKGELKKAKDGLYKDSGFSCPKCGKGMVLKHSKYGFYAHCLDDKTNIGVEMVNDKPVLRPKHEPVAGVKCPECGAGMFKRDGVYGPFLSCESWPKCRGTRKAPFGKKCPKCNNELYATLYKGKTILFCMGYPSCTHSEDPPEGFKITSPGKVMPKKKGMYKVNKVVEPKAKKGSRKK